MGRRIVVTRRIAEPALDLLREAGDLWLSPHDRPLEVPELHEAVAGADAIVTMLHDRVDAALLEAAGPGLRVVANVAVGYDNVDVPACTERGVRFTNTPGVLTDATADIAFALILMATRRLGEGERLIRSGVPWSFNMFFLLGTSVQGKTLGIVGLGDIGQATARRARAFGMEIAYAGRRRVDEAVEAELGGARWLALGELLASSDVVSLHCPLTPETRHMVRAETLAAARPGLVLVNTSRGGLIDADALRSMGSSAYLVNTARGPVVDEAALVDALRDGVIAGAALDVFEREPEVHPGLLELDNVVVVPHLGSATVETRTAMAMLAARNAVAVLAGEEPPTPIRL
jgi:glyoxylate reductase